MYTIGQVAEMLQLPISTLRYYDKEGLLPGIERRSGRRLFSDVEIEALHVIECLKASGLEIKEIRQFMEWCIEGPETYGKRKELFESRKKAVEEEMTRLHKTLDLIRFKCWYYEQAMKDGTEEKLQAIIPDKLPKELRALYDNGHQ